MERLKIIIADDHQILREGIIALIKEREIYQVDFLEACNGQEAIDHYKQNNKIDLVLLDLRMPVKDGVSACTEILKYDRKARIIFLSMFDEGSIINKVLEAGAKGFILKNSGIAEIHDAISNVLTGSEYISQLVVARIIQSYNKTPKGIKNVKKLTEREKDVLHLLSQEKTSGEIAKELDLSKRTVENHRYRLMAKLRAKSTVGLIKIATDNGWILSERKFSQFF